MALKWWIKIIQILKKLIRDIKIIFVIIYYKNLKTVNNIIYLIINIIKCIYENEAIIDISILDLFLSF